MRRLLVVFALGLAMVLPAAAKAELLPTFKLPQELLDFIVAAPASDDLVAGEGKFADGGQFTVSAHGPGPGFAPATGNVKTNIGSVQAHGRVDCLQVVGNQAVIEGTFDEPVEFMHVTHPNFSIIVMDNGEPNGQDPPDTARVALDLVDVPCQFAGIGIGDGPIEQGNIVVMDRP